MDTLTALNTRVSVARLTEPGPSADQVRQLLAAAIRAPDHGMLRPWRFLVLEGEERERLGDIMEWRLLRRQPEADQCARDNIRNKALRAPTIIVAVAEITEGHKVPAWEQVLAVGAAVQNIMVAAHALGIGAMWRTGDLANDETVKARLGFADKDQVVGFVYLGTPAGALKNLPDEQPETFLRELPRGAMSDLDALADRVRAAIPLTTHLDFRFTAFDGERLTLTAPLAPNHNDKGTFFAGSQAALLTLAGWACTTLMADSAVGEGEASVDVVAVESSLQFRAPLHGDIEIRAWADDGESGRFHQRLKRRGKASLAILARATDAQGVVVSEYQGLYLARNNTDNA